MTRHPVEPGRLVLGVLVAAAGVVYLLDATGGWAVPTPALLLTVPAALTVAGFAGAATWFVRRSRPRE